MALDNPLFSMFNDLMRQGNLFEDFKEGRRLTPGEEEETFLTEDELAAAEGKAKPNDNDPFDSKRYKPPAPGIVAEETFFQRITPQREHKYTETELTKMRESCKRTIVHDFGFNDIYHMSDDDRRINDSLSPIRMKLNGLHSSYGRIDQYIEAMRVVVEAWSMIEKHDNFIHSEEEFFQLVASGKIYNPSIMLPKMRHLNRYNIDLVIKYISNPSLDPHDLIIMDPSRQRDQFYDSLDEENYETPDEIAKRMMSIEDMQYLHDHDDNPEKMEVKDIPRKLIKGYDQHNLLTASGKKRKMSKKEEYIAKNLHDMLMKIQMNPENREGSSFSRTSLVTSSMFDQPKEMNSVFPTIRFDGSWDSKYDLFMYDLVMEEERLSRHIPGDTYLTYGDIEARKFFDILEANGIPTLKLRRMMNMTYADLKNNDAKKTKQANKKTEAALLQRITKLNNNPKFKKLIAKAEKAINEEGNE